MKNKNNTRITIKGLKVAEFASQETLCFQCGVYLDGKKIGVADNDGCGASTSVRPISKGSLDEAIAYVDTFPERKIEGYGKSFTIRDRLDNIVDDIAYSMHNDKKDRAMWKRKIKTKLVFKTKEDGDDEYRQIKSKTSPETIKKLLAVSWAKDITSYVNTKGEWVKV